MQLRKEIEEMERKEDEEFEKALQKAEEDQWKLMVERLNVNMATRKEKEGKKKQKAAESQAEKARRKEDESKEEKEREALVEAEAMKRDKKVLIDIGVKKVSCTVSVLRNEHNSILYHKANRAEVEEGQEVSCLMDEAMWTIVFRWLLS